LSSPFFRFESVRIWPGFAKNVAIGDETRLGYGRLWAIAGRDKNGRKDMSNIFVEPAEGITVSVTSGGNSDLALPPMARFGLTISLVTAFILAPCGAMGGALEFDGTGGYVSVATTGALSGTFTVELWAKPYDNNPNGTLGLLGSRRPVDFSFDFIFWQGNHIHGDIGDSSNWITTEANALFPYSINTWYHLAEVVTPTNYSIYVDGSLLVNNNYPADNPLLYDDNHQLVIGNYGVHWPGFAEEYMNGVIDEVRIWNTARTASQIQTNAFRTLTGSEPGLMGYWRFDEGAGGTTADASGHGFDGTVVPSTATGPNWVDSTYADEKLLILNQPQSQSVPAGADLNLSVGVFGADPLSYQWRFNLADIPGATNATLTVRSVNPSASGVYSVLITNQAGTALLSQPALVTVTAPRLQIGAVSDIVLIWWPADASGFVLETSSNLGPGQSWTRFGGAVQIIGDQKVAAADANNGRRFFRLRKQ
jgi:hypothetical protein